MTFHQRALLHAVKMLAAEPIQQQEYLRAMEVRAEADELALSLHDVAIAAPSMLDDNEINPQQYEYVKRIDEMLDSFSGEANAALWTLEALSTAPEWAQVRRIARECLLLLESDTANFGSA